MKQAFPLWNLRTCIIFMWKYSLFPAEGKVKFWVITLMPFSSNAIGIFSENTSISLSVCPISPLWLYSASLEIIRKHQNKSGESPYMTFPEEIYTLYLLCSVASVNPWIDYLLKSLDIWKCQKSRSIDFYFLFLWKANWNHHLNIL